MAIVLDAGALIAIDRRERQVGAMLRVAHREGISVRTSAGVLAQVWRDGARQANLARIITGVDVALLDQTSARRVGELLAASDSRDIVDGHVALLVTAEDTVLTSDLDDLQRLLDTRTISATLTRV